MKLRSDINARTAMVYGGAAFLLMIVGFRSIFATWDVDWIDSDDDQIDFIIDNKPSWIEYESSSGIVTANPHSASHTGVYELNYLLNESNDGCYSISYTHNLVVE